MQSSETLSQNKEGKVSRTEVVVSQGEGKKIHLRASQLHSAEFHCETDIVLIKVYVPSFLEQFVCACVHCVRTSVLKGQRIPCGFCPCVPP